MKKYILLLLLPFIWNCDSTSFNNKNPYIPNYAFSIYIDTNLPTYNTLKYPSNGLVIYDGGATGAIILFNTGNDYKAYDAACPNQALNSCPIMTINGINAVCSCDSAEYNLFSGQSPGQQYPMKPYRVEVSGTVIHVYN